MKLEPVIGLEIHVQLKTKSKMFCSCENIFPASGRGPAKGGGGDVKPNTAVCPVCMGHPGTLPVPNKQAIEWIQLAGTALNCELAIESKFDRKSYFYPDLPKGYQISQFDQPFCGKGELTINVNGEERAIGITRIHLEEDAAKNTHPKGADHTLVDYNRAGTPLIEIVTEPDIRTPEEAKLFLQELQKLIRTLGISDADMEKGQMRCDANISMREEGSDVLNPKTEIKNVNSFKFVEKGLEYEIQRQIKMWEAGEVPVHATRGYDSEASKTVEQRIKEEAADYRYFPEPDIPPFVFKAENLNKLREHLPEMPSDKQRRLKTQYSLSDQQAGELAKSDDLIHLFEDTSSEIEQLNNEQVDIGESANKSLVALAAKIILQEISQMKSHDKIAAGNFAELIVLIHQGKVNSNVVRQILDEMQATGGDPDPIIQNLGLEQVSGEDDLLQWVQQVIEENPDAVEKIKAGKEATIQFLMGQVMAKSGGKANPGKVIEMLKKEING